MKKIYFIALMSAFALAAFSCNKEATEIVDKTEYDVILLVQYTSSSSSSYKVAKNVALTLVDHGKTCTTDSEGKATLKLQQGEYRLSVEKGYEFSSSGYDGYVAEFDGEEYYVLNVYGNALEIITLRED